MESAGLRGAFPATTWAAVSKERDEVIQSKIHHPQFIKDLMNNLSEQTRHDKKTEKVFFQIANEVATSEDSEIRAISATFWEKVGDTGYLTKANRLEAVKLVTEALRKGDFSLAERLLKEIPPGEQPGLRVPPPIWDIKVRGNQTLFQYAVKNYDEHPELLRLLKEKEPYHIKNQVKEMVKSIQKTQGTASLSPQNPHLHGLMALVEVTNDHPVIREEINKLPLNYRRVIQKELKTRQFLREEQSRLKVQGAFDELRRQPQVPENLADSPAYLTIITYVEKLCREAEQEGRPEENNKIRQEITRILDTLSVEQLQAILIFSFPIEKENEWENMTVIPELTIWPVASIPEIVTFSPQEIPNLLTYALSSGHNLHAFILEQLVDRQSPDECYEFCKKSGLMKQLNQIQGGFRSLLAKKIVQKVGEDNLRSLL